MMINQNKLAVEIQKREGGKKLTDIAQVKECLKHTLDLLADEPTSDVLKLLESRK
jgi:hypothetical protein